MSLSHGYSLVWYLCYLRRIILMPQITALLIFPHQLFDAHPGLDPLPDRVSLIEDNLFFGDLLHTAQFHQQKVW